METDEWEGLHGTGTRVRVPFGRFSTVEGEVVLRHRRFGRPLAQVCFEMPVRSEPYETHSVKVSCSKDEMEVISE